VTWKEYGACIGRDPELFFPDPAHGKKAADAAKMVCAGCFVRGQCLDHALTNHEVGIWGGTTEKDRKRIQARYIRNKALASRAQAQ
jgi:WhiB family redox-sensing transcriptional regulator